MGMAAIRDSRFVSGAFDTLDRDALHTAELVKDRRELNRDGKPADDLRLAAGGFGAALSHRANCRHPRIGIRAMTWKRDDPVVDS